MNILDLYRTYKSAKSFKNNALLGKNVQCKAGSCTNLTHDLKRISIGDDSMIRGSLYVTANGNIKIGDHFYMGPNSFIGSENSIEIGRCVIISNDVRIYDNNNHPTSPKAREYMSMNGFSNENWEWCHAASAPVIIEDNVWIGQYCTILKGVRIGKGSIVATRAVVTKDVPPYSMVAGNPAKVVKKIEDE